MKNNPKKLLIGALACSLCATGVLATGEASVDTNPLASFQMAGTRSELPAQYTSSIEEVLHGSDRIYVDFNYDAIVGIEDGTYMLVSATTAGTYKVLYYHNTSNAAGDVQADQITVNYSNGVYTANTDTRFPETHQTWELTKNSEDKYVLKSKTPDQDRYLTSTAINGTRVMISDNVDSAGVFEISENDNGTFYFGAVNSSGEMAYVTHPKDGLGQFAIGSTDNSSISLLKQLELTDNASYIASKDGLNAIIDIAETLDETLYEEAGFASMQVLLDDAKTLASSEVFHYNSATNAMLVETQDNINATSKALFDGLLELVPIGGTNKTELQAKYDEYIVIEQGIYTSSTFRVFEAALANAKTVLDTEDISQILIDAALLELNEAYANLDDGSVTITYQDFPNLNSDNGQPLIENVTGGSSYFRIPALETLDNGWIIASSDIRWRTGGDTPQNLDTIVSVSKDGGQTWEGDIVNYFNDISTASHSQQSAAFIDPALIQDSNGVLHMLVDANPSYVGLMSGNRMLTGSTGFDDDGRVIIAESTIGTDAPSALASYSLRLDQNATKIEAVSSQTGNPTVYLRPITDVEGNVHELTYVDDNFDLFIWEGEGTRAIPKTTTQIDTGDTIIQNLFYRNAEYKVYPVFFIWHKSATVVGDELVWSAPTLLDIKNDGGNRNENFVGVCPGRGMLTTLPDGTERILFSVYDNDSGTEYASSVYSDDGGVTWHRGEKATQVGGAYKGSESQFVELPGGIIRMYSRNSIGKISYTDSTDYGVTWGPYVIDNNLTYTGNCMVSFINVAGTLTSGDNTVYDNLIVASYPKNGSRTDGVVRVGSYDEDTTLINWLNTEDIRYSGKYAYSCLTNLEDGNLGLLYEINNAVNIRYDEFSITEIVPGYEYTAPMAVPQSISIEAISDNDMFIDETVTLNTRVLLTNGSLSDINVNWTSSDSAVATVSEEGLVTGVSAGTVTLTASPEGYADITDTITLNVVANVPTSVMINGSDSITLDVSSTSDLNADVTWLSGGVTTDDITWTSSNNAVATVSADGLVTGVSEGNAVITVAVNGYANITDTVSVTVENNSTEPSRPRPSIDDDTTDVEDGDVPLAEIPDTDTPLTDGDTLSKLDDISDSWAYDSIKYVVENGLMNGVSEMKFEPNETASRAMVWTILARMNEVDTTTDDIWYQVGLDWAVENEISDGTNPLDNITREQFVTMLYRINAPEIATTETVLGQFTDADDISEFAVSAMEWAVSKGIITGKTEDTIAPQDNILRAEIATIIQRYLEMN